MANDDSNPWQDVTDPGFEETTRTQAEMDHRQGYDAHGNKKRSPWGCLLYGCLTVVLLGTVAMIVAGVALFYFAKGQVEQYTDETPIPIAEVEMSDEEIAALEARVEAFQQMVDPTEPIDAEADEPAVEEATAKEKAPVEALSKELVLTADDINALIAKDSRLKGHVFIRIEDGNISGDVSIPTDFLPLMGGGRYFNASATFEVSLDRVNNRSKLVARLVSAEVKGEPLPQHVIDSMSSEVFANDIQEEPEIAQLIDQLESLRIEGDRLILKVRTLTAEERAKIKAQIEADAIPVPLSE